MPKAQAKIATWSVRYRDHQVISAHRDSTQFIEPTPSSCGIMRLASPEEQFQQVEMSTREAKGLYPPRSVVSLRCHLLSLLRIHRPDCEHCNAREKYGVEMRNRLEELNWRTQAHSLSNGDYGEVGSKPGEVVARLPVSLEAQKPKKTA
jgi:hypothetical protein